jgi:tRNA threonylcarbamoyladenosine biosynthesis protein TsaB
MTPQPSPIASGSPVLALDTGSPWVSVALARVSGITGDLAAVRAAVMERSSSQVLEMMREILAETGTRPGDLGGIVALRGPGSFTGVRIGLSTAFGFYQALGLPATGLSTFEVLALAADAPNGAVTLAAADALRGDWSVQAFAAGKVLAELGAPELVPAARIPALFDRLGAPPDGRVLAGFGLDRLTALPGWPPEIRLFTPEPDRPLAAVAALRAADPAMVWDPGLLIAPLYSRPPAVTLPRPRGPAPDRP